MTFRTLRGIPYRVPRQGREWSGNRRVKNPPRHFQSQTLEQSLLQAEKIAATGRMAATIAHEINNPLEAVTNLLLPRLVANQTLPDLHYQVVAQSREAR
jgi:signal transduction histidine kinase